MIIISYSRIFATWTVRGHVRGQQGANLINLNGKNLNQVRINSPLNYSITQVSSGSPTRRSNHVSNEYPSFRQWSRQSTRREWYSNRFCSSSIKPRAIGYPDVHTRVSAFKEWIVQGTVVINREGHDYIETSHLGIRANVRSRTSWMIRAITDRSKETCNDVTRESKHPAETWKQSRSEPIKRLLACNKFI